MIEMDEKTKRALTALPVGYEVGFGKPPLGEASPFHAGDPARRNCPTSGPPYVVGLPSKHWVSPGI